MRRTVVLSIAPLLAFTACHDGTSPSTSSRLAVAETIDLGTMPSATYHEARAVNDQGSIVGFFTEAVSGRSINRPARWQSTTITDISGLPPSSTITNATPGVGLAFGINASGVVAGDLPGVPGTSPAPLSRAALFRNGTVELLPIPRPSRADPSSARGINDAGDAVGLALFAPTNQTTTVSTTAALWRPGAVPMNLGALTSTASSNAADINNKSQIVGTSFDANNNVRAVRFESGGQVVDLGTLTGHTAAQAYAINDDGTIVGYSTVGATSAERSANRQAVRWDGTQTTKLAMPPGHTASVAYGLNEAGDIVGMSVAADGTTRAVIWRGDTVLELGFLTGTTSSVAYGINDKGDVVGRSGTQGVHWKIAPVLAPNVSR